MVSKRSCTYWITWSFGAGMAFVAGLLTLHVVSCDVQPPPSFPLTISFSADKHQYSPKEAIFGTITLTNVSQMPIRVESHGYWLQFVDFRFTDAEGNALPTSNYGAAYAIRLIPSVEVIRPGTAQRSSAVPSIVLDRKELPPGRYTIQAIFTYRGIQAESRKVDVEIAAPQEGN
jgi:hypothetical protein